MKRKSYKNACVPFIKLFLNTYLKTTITMNQKHQAKLKAREARQARQARRVINGIFIGLIVLMILFLLCYYFFFG